MYLQARSLDLIFIISYHDSNNELFYSKKKPEHFFTKTFNRCYELTLTILMVTYLVLRKMRGEMI